MGMAINSLGNDEKIKIHFAYINNLTDKSFKDIVPDDFPAKLWSLGFLYPFGGWFGSLIGAASVDKFGRKPPTIFFSMLAILGAAMKVFSKSLHFGILFGSRFLDGVATSGMMVSVILLLFEVAPKKIENVYKPMIQISVNAGILFIGFISLPDFSKENWNYVHIATGIFALILLITTLVLPESPKYLYMKGRISDSEEGIKFRDQSLRGQHYSPDEFEALKPFDREARTDSRMSVMAFLKTSRFRLPIISLIMLHLGQQLCGINAIMAFAPTLLRSLNYGRPDIGGLVITSIGLLGSLLFAPFVGNQRRKVLWLTGFIFMFISFSAYLASDYLNAPEQLKLFWLCLFVFMFQIGPGPVAWFISVEMFPTEASGAAQGVASFFNWFANTMAAIKINTLYIFIFFQAVIILYSAFFVVETHNKSPQQVLDEYDSLLHA
ncbi:hypothetical protein MXB_938 [Myxobolus squamalis]|nr:hypothetical protein MXB_938 [Myxobolus squamalis]